MKKFDYIKKFRELIEFICLFTLSMLLVYFIELILLMIKNKINGQYLFNFPLGFIYIGFL